MTTRDGEIIRFESSGASWTTPAQRQTLSPNSIEFLNDPYIVELMAANYIALSEIETPCWYTSEKMFGDFSCAK